jgi:hypothetical protein
MKMGWRKHRHADSTTVCTFGQDSGLKTGSGKEVGLDVNTEKVKLFMLISRHQNPSERHDTKAGDITSQNVVNFKYFEMSLTKKLRTDWIRTMLGAIQFSIC